MNQVEKSPNGHFSSRLENAMRKRGWKGVDLATAADVTPTAVSRYLNGRIPGSEELHRIAEALETTMDWLYSGVVKYGESPIEGARLNEPPELSDQAMQVILELGRARTTINTAMERLAKALHLPIPENELDLAIEKIESLHRRKEHSRR